MPFRITSPAFADGSAVPVRHTCDGENLSPRLTWSGAPDTTRAFALIVDDPDAPRGTFTHWVLYDIPPETTELAEGIQGGSIGISGTNSFGKTGYGGPCPPPGDEAHRYRFTLHALDLPSFALSPPVTREDLDAKLTTHVLATTQLIGKYQRQPTAAGVTRR
jgi:Raf kinase inhibitor-like YbhB/YbcL family protein